MEIVAQDNILLLLSLVIKTDQLYKKTVQVVFCTKNPQIELTIQCIMDEGELSKKISTDQFFFLRLRFLEYKQEIKSTNQWLQS